MRATVDVSDVVHYGRQLGESIYKRAIIDVKRELEAGGSEIADDAMKVLRRKQDKSATSTGLASQGIIWEEATVKAGGVLEVLIGWTRKYGVILEHGPLKMREWIIRAKRAAALRFWGAEGRVAGNIAGSVVYAQWVRHTWDESQKREHMGPAADKNVPKIEKRILGIAGRALQRVR